MLTPEARRQLARLVSINTNDMLDAAGLGTAVRGRRLLEVLCWPAAYHLARHAILYDHHVGRAGLQAGAAHILRYYAHQLEVAGRELVPVSGPLLVVSNHPGVSDTVALFASLPRTDLRIVAADRPFLQALPHTSRRLIYARDLSSQRLVTLRSLLDHLRAGGAALTFPAGEIEPDPALDAPAAVAALRGWSESIGLIVRLVPDVVVVTAIVSGVLSAAAQRHPATRLRRQPRDRERLGAMLQIVVPMYRKVCVRVAFGRPLTGADLLRYATDAAGVTQLVIGQAGTLIDSPPRTWQPLELGQPAPVAALARARTSS